MYQIKNWEFASATDFVEELHETRLALDVEEVETTVARDEKSSTLHLKSTTSSLPLLRILSQISRTPSLN